MELLRQGVEPKSVDLIMTSPPFGLVRKKDYGNVDADEYVEWFKPFAEGFKRLLKPSGSLVSMKELLVKGYTPRLRPSGHDISEKFGTDNGRTIPPSFFAPTFAQAPWSWN